MHKNERPAALLCFDALMKHSCNPINAQLCPSHHVTVSPHLFTSNTISLHLLSSALLNSSLSFSEASIPMAAPTFILPSLFVLLAIVFLLSGVQAQVDEKGLKVVDAALPLPLLEWPTGMDEDDGFWGEEEEGDGESRRSLFWRRVRYYISYGALSANRIPCPPRSGRSYYTHNCYNSRVPVNPYSRGCSRITRCRR